MGKGRPRKPTAEKEATGAFKKNPQRRPVDEPSPERGRPDVPDSVAGDAIALATWNEACDILDRMEVLTLEHSKVIEQYATTVSQWRKYYDHIVEHGVSAISGKGAIITSPEAHQYNKLADRILKILPELGFTPASRSKLKAIKVDKEENPMGSLLSRMAVVG